ncbi:ribonuclease H-like domain-containing protein [Tanacetum coccineum]
MRMRQYICHIDHNLWDIIVDGDLQEEAAPAGEQSGPPALKTAKQRTAKKNQERVKSILLLAMPDEYLLKLHNVPDAKSLWAAIKSRFRGNDESKKMQRNVLKHQFENFTTTPNERSMNTSSTNEVSAASGNFKVNTAGGTSLTNQVSSTPGADEVIDQDDLEELDIRWQVAMLTVRVQRFIQKTGRNLNFKGKQLITFDKSKVECYNCHRKGHFAKECKSRRNQGKRPYGDNGRRNATTNEPSSQALVAQDGLGGYDWSNDFDEPVNYAFMAISSSSSSSSSDNEVQNCSKQCLKSFKTLQKNFDSEREKHSGARLEIQGYELALESIESRIIGHEKNELA